MKLFVQELDKETFRPFGEFEALYEVGKGEDGFFPDFSRLTNDGKDTSISLTRVSGTCEVIKTAEYHNNCAEGLLPLDGDIYIYVAPPHWFVNLENTQLFRIPKGTFVKLKPGVIHGAPLSVTGQAVNVLILLPERTYSNDCVFMELEEAQWMYLEK